MCCKAAFIVESGFLENHFGVRNYFSTIKKAMDEMGIITEYLIHSNTLNGTIWYKVDIEKASVEFTDRYIESTSGKINSKRIEQFNKKYKCNIPVFHKYLRCIGRNLKYENYKYAVISNPWTIDGELDIVAEIKIGIVYDFIASMYTITKNNIGFDLGYYHQRGYDYYNHHCQYIVAISGEISQQYKAFYPEFSDKVTYFKPFVPYGISRGEYESNDKKENAIILAAPFDLRKGLEDMPEIINAAKESLDTLYIFGMPRCLHKDVDKFFSELEIPKVVYYPYISYEGLIRLYKKCKFLLFPSFEEGLGFPIIEAQVCGCRVIIRNLHPMNELTLNGALLMEDDKTNILTIKDELCNGLQSEFNYSRLSMDARNRFLYKDIRDFFTNRCKFRDIH